MNLNSYYKVKISGVASALPTDSVSIDSFKPVFGEKTVDDFVKMVGVKKYHKSSVYQTASDLAFVAGKKLLESKQVNRDEISLLIFVTQKPDRRYPSTAFTLHQKLKLSRNCMAFDMNLACSGYVYALNTAASLIAKGIVSKALVLTGDTSNRTMAPEDRTTIMLFGDNGSATLLEKTDEESTINSLLRTNGKSFKSIVTPAGAYRRMDAPVSRVTWSDGIKRSDYDTRMKGMEVFSFSISDVPRLINDFLESCNKTEKDFDLFALHQANQYILNQITRKCKLSKERVHSVIAKYGNNSSSSVPIVLSDRYGSVISNEYNRVLLCGFGAGLSWGVMSVMVNARDVLPVTFTDYYFGDKIHENERNI